jgi:hypothetical protein
MSGPGIILIGVVCVLAYLIYDRMKYRMRARRRREGTESGLSRRFSMDPKVYIMIGLTVFIAFLYFRPIDRPDTAAGTVLVEEGTAPAAVPTGQCLLVAAFILVVGVWWAIRQSRKEKMSQKLVIGGQVNELVNAFKSVFRIRPTVFSALEEANRKIPPPVGTAVAHAVTTFYVTSLPTRAFGELRTRIQDPYMDQFVYILERGEDAKHDDIMSALNDLLTRLRAAREMRDKSEVNMTVISGQTKIIQFIAVALVMVVGFVPMLRLAYESLPTQLLFIGIAGVGVLTSWYIDRKSQALKEKVL